jgi:O-antigen/teichoic acid export membrane protein
MNHVPKQALAAENLAAAAAVPNPAPAPPTDSFAKRTLWLSVARLISLALSFLLPFILVRKLSTAEFGLYKQAFQILQTALGLLGLQVSGGIYYFLPRHPDKKAQVALNAVLFYTLVGAAVALWFALHPAWVTQVFQGDGLVPIIPLLGLTILLWLIASAFESVMIADHDVRRASVTAVLLQLTKTLLLIGAALWQGDIRTMVWAALLFGSLHCGLFLLYLYRRFGRFWWPLDGALFRAQLANALPFGIGAFAFSWQYDLHNYFVMHYFDAAGYAIYSTGCFQLPLLLVLLDATDTIMIPEIARLEKEGNYRRIIETWLGALRTLALCFVPACTLMFVLRRELIVGLYTDKLSAAVPIFAIALLNTLLLMNLTGSVMRAFEALKYYRIKLYLCLMPVTWCLLYAGVKLAGLAGVMLAVVLVRGLDVTLTVNRLAQCLGMTRRDWHYATPLLRIMAAAGAAGLLTYAVKPLLPAWHPLATFLTGGLVFGMAYLPLALVSGAVTEPEKEQLRGLLRKFAGVRARFGFSTAA